MSRIYSQFTRRKANERLSLDLSSPYRNIIRLFFPNAKIVADRFHVVSIIYHHFMNLARAVAPTLKSHRGGLTAMRKRPSRLTVDPEIDWKGNNI